MGAIPVGSSGAGCGSPEEGLSRAGQMAPPNPALEAYLDELSARFNKKSDEFKETYVRDTFSQFDEDKSGFIDPDEFHALCKRISPQMTEEEIADALEVIDEDGDGEISFEEFSSWWNGDHAAELRERCVVCSALFRQPPAAKR